MVVIGTWGVQMLGQFRRWTGVLAALALSGCAHTNIEPGFLDQLPSLDPQTFTCCADPEKFYPKGFMRAVFSVADEYGPDVRKTMYGRYDENGYPGRLAGNTAAQAAVMAQLQPLDLVFTANKSYLWGNLIPGRFSHDVVYLGTEAQLIRAGLWTHPALAPLRSDIRAGRLFIEAIAPAAQTIDAARVMESDAVAILRPRLSPAARLKAYTALANSIGVPYDYTFDVTSTDRLACTELINLAMPSLRIQTRLAYGRTVIFPDEIVAQAIRDERIQLIGYMAGSKGGYVWRNTHSLMGDIAAYWGLPGSNQ